MITEKAVGLLAGGTAVVAPMAATMLDGVELKVIAFLLSIVAGLMSLVCKFMWDMRKDNRETHLDLYDKIEHNEVGLLPRLSRLEGSHDAAFQARGCAYDPKRLEDMVAKAVAAVFEERSHDCRNEDCNDCIEGTPR